MARLAVAQDISGASGGFLALNLLLLLLCISLRPLLLLQLLSVSV
ncbi:hypothetical protein [Aeromonas simiae]